MKRQVFNPYLPGWEFIPDGEPHRFDGRVYIYGSHDEAGGSIYCTGDHVCWSAPEDDLSAWSFEGTIFRKEDVPNVSPKHQLFAPDVAKGPDGRYYLYYFLSDIKYLGVAVCNTPAGRYHHYGHVHFQDGTPLTTQSGYGLPFDPAILCEPEGNWLYYGFGMQSRRENESEEAYKGGYVARLADDMLTIIGEPVRTIPGKLYAEGTCWEGHAYLEASSIRHYGDLYYLIYSSEHGHELCYATSKYPDRDYVYRGVVISHGDVGMPGHPTEAEAVYYLGNNHGGMVQAGGKTYIFYHRHTNGNQYSRQGCAEKIAIGEDGSIPQVEVTSCGLNGGPLRAKGCYPTHIACQLSSANGIQHYSSRVHWDEAHPYIALEKESGAATQQTPYIFNLRNGASCGFKYFSFDGDESCLRIRTKGGAKGEVHLHLDAPNGPAIASAAVVPSEKWAWAEATLKTVQGIHALYFTFVLDGALDFSEFELLVHK